MKITEAQKKIVPYRSLTAAVHQQVALDRVELGSRYHLRQLLHVGGFNVHYVEALVGDLEMPQVDAKVVRREVGLLVGVDRYRIDVVGVGVREDTTGRSLDRQLRGFDGRNTEGGEAGRVDQRTALRFRVVTFHLRKFPV